MQNTRTPFDIKPPSFASNKTKLAHALGIGRSLLYQFARLPDSPLPRANGMWHVPTWRAFIAKKRESVKASEKERLQIACLKIRLEREQHELDQARETTRKQILDDLTAQFVAAAQLIRTELFKVKNELCPRFEGQSAREIYRLWTDREGEAFKNVTHELNKRTGGRIEERDTRPTVKVGPFERRAVAG
jgi:hypothetical protein